VGANSINGGIIGRPNLPVVQYDWDGVPNELTIAPGVRDAFTVRDLQLDNQWYNIPIAQYTIDQCMRFSSFLTSGNGWVSGANKQPITPAQYTFTTSFWIKLGKQNGQRVSDTFLWSSGTGGSAFETIRLKTESDLDFFAFNGTAYKWRVLSDPILQDYSGWYHIVTVRNSAIDNNAEELKIFINGRQIDFASASYPVLNELGYVALGTNFFHVGSYQDGSGSDNNTFDGLMAEFYFVDGQSLDPTYFGETDPATGRWIPKKYTGRLEDSSFYLNFANATTNRLLGANRANSNTPTYVGTAGVSVAAGTASDQCTDSPVAWGADNGLGGEMRGNFIKWDASQTYAPHNGVIDYGGQRINNDGSARTNILLPLSGKWYCEADVTVINTGLPFFGIVAENRSLVYTDYPGENTVGIKPNASVSNRPYLVYNFNAAYAELAQTAVGAGTVYSLFCDMDRSSVWVGVNGKFFGLSGANILAPCTTNDILSGANPAIVLPLSARYFVAGYTVNTASLYLNTGYRRFSYPAPAGYKCLCANNLTYRISDPQQYFGVATWSGNGTSQVISSLKFQPDLVWIKNRTAATSHYWVDSVRGNTATLSSNSTGREETIVQGIQSFNSDGFTVGSDDGFNKSANNYVAWCWKKDPVAGFNIITYTGNGSNNRSILHSLSAVPKMIIIKCRDRVTNWAVYHAANTASPRTNYLYLNSTNGTAVSAAYWADQSPDSTQFYVGSGVDVNNSGSTYVAYVWAEVDGFSKFGGYTGNGSADGPFITCNFAPRWGMFKRNVLAGEHWYVEDFDREGRWNKAAKTNHLQANLNTAENVTVGIATNELSFISNGLKVRSTDNGHNDSAQTYIYALFADAVYDGRSNGR